MEFRGVTRVSNYHALDLHHEREIRYRLTFLKLNCIRIKKHGPCVASPVQIVEMKLR
jgi:hypothetical protein